MDQLSDYHTDYIRELIRAGKARVSRVGDLQFSKNGQYAMPTNQSAPPPASLWFMTWPKKFCTME